MHEHLTQMPNFECIPAYLQLHEEDTFVGVRDCTESAPFQALKVQ